MDETVRSGSISYCGPEVVKQAIGLKRSCRLAKHSHFYASRRYLFYQFVTGFPVVVINLFTSSALLYLINDSMPSIAILGAAALSFYAAVSAGLQTYCKFDGKDAEHRSVANRYANLSKTIEYLLSRYNDKIIDLKVFDGEFKVILDQYHETNLIAETVPFRERDFAKSEKYIEQ